ncbi:MAG: hypothetical protein FWE18_00265 [Alphaproteobacteria bacterium]|nr:hypothetical protein [Alphaproteobacteria bacterium]
MKKIPKYGSIGVLEINRNLSIFATQVISIDNEWLECFDAESELLQILSLKKTIEWQLSKIIGCDGETELTKFFLCYK